MKRWHHLTWKSLLGLIAACVLLLATAGGLFRVLSPLVPSYRQQAQVWASNVLGRPVEIGGMGARLGLQGPELTLTQVAILTHDRRYVLIEAQEVRLGFTLGAVLHGQFSRPSLIILMQPRLVLERETDGSYNVRGLQGSLTQGAEQTNWRAAAAEAFAQNAAVRVRGGQVTLIDMRTPATPLVFSGLRLDLDNSRDAHRLSGRMQLPAALGRSLSFNALVQGEGLEPQAWQWRVEVQGDSLNLPRWLDYWPAASGRFHSGQVDVRAALTGLGARVDQAEGSITARAIAPAAAAGFDLLHGALAWTRTAKGWLLTGHDVQLRRGADLWPASQFNLRYTLTPTDSASWSGDASFLRLQDVTLLSTWLPAGFTPATARLQQLQPNGDLIGLQFSAQQHDDRLTAWTLSGRFAGLGLHADGDIPGFSNLNGTLSADQEGGSLVLSGTNATATFPHLFRGPLAASTLQAEVQFQHQTQGWEFTLKDLSVANPDVQHAEAHGTLLLPADGSSPWIDLQASAENADAKNKSAYFPVGIMPKQVVAWLDSAIAGGQVPTGSLVLRGRLADFPYDRGQGLFDIRFRLLHGTLMYASDWPPVKDLDADVEFKDQGMYVKVAAGTILGDQIGGATADFADLRNGRLHIQGTARGGATAALEFLRGGPLQSRFGHLLDGLGASGTTDVSLNLHLPVEHVEQYKLDGQAQMHNVSLTFKRLPQWPVTALHGTLKITEQGVSTNELQGVFLGEPLRVKLSPDSEQDTTLIAITGGAQAAQLAAALPAAFKSVLNGATTWQLNGSLPNQPAQSKAGLALTLHSSLQGLGLALPLPFAKLAATAEPLQAALVITGGQAPQFELHYAQVMDGVYRFAQRDGVWSFDRGALVFGGKPAALPPTPGLSVSGTLADFSLDDWKPFIPARTGAPVYPPTLPAWLQSSDLTISHFTGFDQHIENLTVKFTRAAGHGMLVLNSQPLDGSITWPFQPGDTHPIVVSMQRVMLVRKVPAGKTAEPPPKLDPREVPPLQMNIQQFRYNDITLGHLHVELEPQAQGVALKALTVASPGFDLQANGQWTAQPDGGQHTVLNVQLQSRDIQQTLQAFGFAPAISGTNGALEAELNWPGGPLAEILPVLNGKLHVKLQHGSLLELKPGAGRVFGLLSLNALPRRLLLNFSDVLGKGLAYDSIEGDFIIQKGDAYTSDLTVSGPAAKIHMVGRTGLATHDFDEAVVVVPSVGSTLPVIGALAGGVGVGAVVFLLTEIFKKPLSAVGETRYHLSGTWDNPKLTEIVPPKPAASKP